MVAMQKRSPYKDTFPSRWDVSAAGHIGSGDESRPTAVRELAEELGVICVEEDLDFMGTVPAEQACLKGCNCFEDVYVLRCDSESIAFAVGEAEVSAVEWFPIAEWEEKLVMGNDPRWVPRVSAYTRAFFRHLQDKHGCVW